MGEPVLATLGERVRWARKQVGLTQVQLADLAGIHKDTISGWETGGIPGADVREANLRAVAPYLRVPVEWLREGGPTPRIPPKEPRSTDMPTPGPPRSMGRRRSDLEIRAQALRKDAARLGVLADLMRAYREMGRPASPEVIGEWLEILADNSEGDLG